MDRTTSLLSHLSPSALLANLKGFKLTRLRLAIMTLTVMAIVWILVQHFLFRPAACLQTMCPVNDLSYLRKIAIVIILSTGAVWLLKPNQKSS